ncbi:hypothetical protein [Bacteroides acidifaciens]|uniref:hypothetical protein n=1 Tax=Bacteroides acidifaciens TaxID=85831 RepID=UPI003F694492
MDGKRSRGRLDQKNFKREIREKGSLPQKGHSGSVKTGQKPPARKLWSSLSVRRVGAGQIKYFPVCMLWVTGCSHLWTSGHTRFPLPAKRNSEKENHLKNRKSSSLA